MTTTRTVTHPSGAVNTITEFYGLQFTEDGALTDHRFDSAEAAFEFARWDATPMIPVRITESVTVQPLHDGPML
jgi:hypothetical protein